MVGRLHFGVCSLVRRCRFASTTETVSNDEENQLSTQFASTKKTAN